MKCISLWLLAIVTQVTAIGFNSRAQKIDVSGPHAFVPPGPNDQRGPCPGLNALANHGYLPHNGAATFAQFIEATSAVYGMGVDLATFLAVYGAIFDGDLVSWSIGGPTPAVGLPDLLSQPRGLSFSHNKYEGDASQTRGDLFLTGDPNTLQMPLLEDLLNTRPGPDNNYNLDVLNANRVRRIHNSRSTNPFYFSGPFPGVLVVNGGNFFSYRFMGNKSAEHPEGIFDREVLKSFFGVTGSGKDLVYRRGHERIPDNWYRRAFGDEYTIPFFLSDIVFWGAKYPEILAIGGNTGTVNSFTAIDPSDITGGVYSARTLLQGNNLGCFIFQGIVQQAPDLLNGQSEIALSLVQDLVGNVTSKLGCPQLSKYDTSVFNRFPGYTQLRKDGTYGGVPFLRAHRAAIDKSIYA